MIEKTARGDADRQQGEVASVAKFTTPSETIGAIRAKEDLSQPHILSLADMGS